MQQVRQQDYEIVRFLGTGKFGKVYEAVERNLGQEVALKFIPKKHHIEESKKQEAEVCNEIEAMMRVEHENVIKVYGIDWDAQMISDNSEDDPNPAFMIAIELAKGGVLFNLLFKSNTFDTIVIRTFFHQILLGLQACHQSGVAHRDLKCENMLLDDEYRVKIGDFGLSKLNQDLSVEHLMETQCGTPSYLAPEVIKGKLYTTKADIFSLGVVLFAMVTKLMPFEYATSRDWWYVQIKKRRPDMFWMAHEKSANRTFDDDFKELVDQMLLPNPEERPGIQEIMGYEWMQGGMLSQSDLTALIISHKRKKLRRYKEVKRRLGRRQDANFRDAEVPPDFEPILPKSLPADEEEDVFAVWNTDETDSEIPDIRVSREHVIPAENVEKPLNEDDGYSAIIPNDVQEVQQILGPSAVQCHTEAATTESASVLMNAIEGILITSQIKYKASGYSVNFEVIHGDGSIVELSATVCQDDEADQRIVQFRRVRGDNLRFYKTFLDFVFRLTELIETDADDSYMMLHPTPPRNSIR